MTSVFDVSSCSDFYMDEFTPTKSVLLGIKVMVIPDKYSGFIHDDTLVLYKSKYYKILSRCHYLGHLLIMAKCITTFAHIDDKPVSIYIDSDGYYPKCPTCGYYDLPIHIDRCPACGQSFNEW